MLETRVQCLGGEDALKKEIEIYSSIPARKIPWTEEPGKLQSMGSQRVGHNWATNTHTLLTPCKFSHLYSLKTKENKAEMSCETLRWVISLEWKDLLRHHGQGASHSMKLEGMPHSRSAHSDGLLSAQPMSPECVLWTERTASALKAQTGAQPGHGCLGLSYLHCQNSSRFSNIGWSCAVCS